MVRGAAGQLSKNKNKVKVCASLRAGIFINGGPVIYHLRKKLLTEGCKKLIT